MENIKNKKKGNRNKNRAGTGEQHNVENTNSVTVNENVTEPILDGPQTSDQNPSLIQEPSHTNTNSLDQTQHPRQTAKKYKYRKFDMSSNEKMESESTNPSTSIKIPASTHSESTSQQSSHPAAPFPYERYKATPALVETWVYFSSFFERIQADKMQNTHLINLAEEKSLNVTINTGETISCMWEPAKNDLSFDTRHPDWLGFEKLNSSNTHSEMPSREPTFTTPNQNTDYDLNIRAQQEQMEKLNALISQLIVATTASVVTSANNVVINQPENIAIQPKLVENKDEDIQDKYMAGEVDKLIKNDSKVEGESIDRETRNVSHQIYENTSGERVPSPVFTFTEDPINEINSEQMVFHNTDPCDVSEEDRIYLQALLKELDKEIKSRNKTQQAVNRPQFTMKVTCNEFIPSTTVTISQNYNFKNGKTSENTSWQKPRQQEYVFEHNVQNIPHTLQNYRRNTNIPKNNYVQPLFGNIIEPEETYSGAHRMQYPTDKPFPPPQFPNFEGYNDYQIRNQPPNFYLEEIGRPTQHVPYVSDIPRWRQNISPYIKRDIVCTESICYPYSHNINVLSYAPSNIAQQSLNTSTVAGNANHRVNQMYHKSNVQWQQPNMQPVYQPPPDMYFQNFENPIQQNINPFQSQINYQRPQQWQEPRMQQYNPYQHPTYNTWQNNHGQPMWMNANYSPRCTTPVMNAPFLRTSPIPPQHPVGNQNPFYGPYPLHTSFGDMNLADRREIENNYDMQPPAIENIDFSHINPINENISSLPPTPFRNYEEYGYGQPGEINYQNLPTNNILPVPQTPYRNYQDYGYGQAREMNYQNLPKNNIPLVPQTPYRNYQEFGYGQAREMNYQNLPKNNIPSLPQSPYRNYQDYGYGQAREMNYQNLPTNIIPSVPQTPYRNYQEFGYGQAREMNYQNLPKNNIPPVPQSPCRNYQEHGYGQAREMNYQNLPTNNTLQLPKFPWGNLKSQNIQQTFVDPSVYQHSLKDSHPEIYNIWESQRQGIQLDSDSDKISDVTVDMTKLDMLNIDKQEIPRKENIARSRTFWRGDIPVPIEEESKTPNVENKQDDGQQLDMNNEMGPSSATTNQIQNNSMSCGENPSLLPDNTEQEMLLSDKVYVLNSDNASDDESNILFTKSEQKTLIFCKTSKSAEGEDEKDDLHNIPSKQKDPSSSQQN